MELKNEEQTASGLQLKQEKTEMAVQNTFSAQPAEDGNNNTQPEQNEWGKYTGWEEQNQDTYVDARPRLTQKEFYKHPVMKKHRGNVNACGIIVYICAVITFVFNVFLLQNFFGIVDVMILVGLGLGIQIGKSRVCAIILLVYSVINMIYLLMTTGRLGGYLIVICGVYAVIGTFKLKTAWKEYELKGSYPGI